MRVTEPQAIRERILHYASQPQPQEFSPGLKGAIIGEMEKIIKVIHTGEEATYRKIVFGWLFGDENKPPEPMSSKSTVLTPQMWFGLKKWIGMKPVVEADGKTTWTHREEFEEELWWVVARAKCVFDLAQKTGPAYTLGQANAFIQKELLIQNVQDYLQYDGSGMVSAGIQKGGSFITVIPYEEPVTVETQPTIPPQPPRKVSTGSIQYIGATVSNVDESEL